MYMLQVYPQKHTHTHTQKHALYEGHMGFSKVILAICIYVILHLHSMFAI